VLEPPAALTLPVPPGALPVPEAPVAGAAESSLQAEASVSDARQMK
jgi:hypothetical protein